MNDLTIQKSQPISAVAATDSQRAIAEVQAALFIARQNPRNMVAVLDRVANAFTRPGLAEVSEYAYARGGTNITGPSIRAAEAIAQLYQNVQFGFRELSRSIDDDGVGVSEMEAFCFDVENNVRQARQFRVRHWRDTKQGGKPLKDERDIYELTANMAQRRVRACILSVLPGDLIESAMNQAAVTLKTSADTSPESQKRIVAAFAEFGVTVEQIETRIQRRLDAIQPAQVIQLKRIITSIRDGMSTADSWFEQGASDDAEPKRKSESKPAPAFVPTQPPPAVDPAKFGIPHVDDGEADKFQNRENFQTFPPQTPQVERARELGSHIAPYAGPPFVAPKLEPIQPIERQPGEDDDIGRDEPPSPPVSAGQAAWLKRKANELKVDLKPLLASIGANDPAQLSQAQFEKLRGYLK